MTITILKTETLQPLGPAIKRPSTKPAPEAVQIKPGIWQRPDGRLETRDPVPKLPAVPNALAESLAQSSGAGLIGLIVGARIVIVEEVGDCCVGDTGSIEVVDAFRGMSLVHIDRHNDAFHLKPQRFRLLSEAAQ